MECHQRQDPFRFLIYAEMAGAEIGPAACNYTCPAAEITASG